MSSFLIPDLTIVRRAERFLPNRADKFPLFHQIRKEAGLEKVGDAEIDRFLDACGKHALTIEIIDYRFA